MAGLPNVMQTGQTGLFAAKAAIATTGHNITNANTEGYSRQRVMTENMAPEGSRNGKFVIGKGTHIDRIERVNDHYLEKQLREGHRDLSSMEEKATMFTQVESVFNEMDGEGLNRLMSRFFNDFRKLSNDPNSEAIRESVRESASAMIGDLKRLRTDLVDVRKHIDSRIEGHVGEMNSLAKKVQELNLEIKKLEIGGQGPANDLRDQRDKAMKQLGSFVDLSLHQDENGSYIVDIKGIGPYVSVGTHEKFGVQRTKADDRGKAENALDVTSTSYAGGVITHSIKGGKLGGLLEVRDKTVEQAISRLDEIAFAVSQAVNTIHEQGFNRQGVQGVSFFKPMASKERAAENIDLSDAIKQNVSNIATAVERNAPGDNRIALAISGLQGTKLMNNGTVSVDDFFNAIVSDVGILSARNKESFNQQKSINTQLSKMRESVSGVSIDEETANLLQYQHVFDASAKVIQVADKMLETILNIGQ